jgi:hypothetical protein
LLPCKGDRFDANTLQQKLERASYVLIDDEGIILMKEHLGGRQFIGFTRISKIS